MEDHELEQKIEDSKTKEKAVWVVTKCPHCQEPIMSNEAWISDALDFDPFGEELKTTPVHKKCEKEHYKTLCRILFTEYLTAEKRFWHYISQRLKADKKEPEDGD